LNINSALRLVGLKCDQTRGRGSVDLASRLLRSTAQCRRPLFYCPRTAALSVSPVSRSVRQSVLQPTQESNRYQIFFQLSVRYSVIADGWSGLELPEGWGFNPQFMSTDATLIFEWQSALNFNLWAKFQTFRHLTPLRLG